MPLKTELKSDKTRCRTEGKLNNVGGAFAELSGLDYEGYEIHMGETCSAQNGEKIEASLVTNGENVYGSYIHGIFDKGEIAGKIVEILAKNAGVAIENGQFEDYASFKEKQYDKLADTIRKYMDMEAVYGMLREARLD